MCEISGYSESELLNKTMMEIQHPDDIVTESEGIEHLLRGEIPSFTPEKRLIHKDGASVDLPDRLGRQVEKGVKSRPMAICHR